MEELRKMKDIINQGEYFQSMLYTYRSCSNAVPRVKTSDDPNKTTIYEKIYEILEPEVGKLKKLMFFQKDAISYFKQIVDNVKTGLGKKLVYSEEYVMHMIQMLDMFTRLDALKDMKACLNNDFSFFKRAFGFLRKNMGNDDQTQENHTLYLFLANNNSITTSLKSELQNINGFDDALSLVANMCADYMEQEL
jgi:cytoplasmic FMR1 interacting protein